MKQKIISTAAMLLLVGCAQTAPNLDGINGNISDATQIASDTVSVDEEKYSTEKDNNVYNSSTNGFKSIYFGFGGYEVSSDMENRMITNVGVARNTGGAKIKIEGNCDEFGTDEYNYALGLKRAKSIKDSIVAQGVSPASIVTVSYGESNPVCNEPTDTCYNRNRRVDLRLAR